MKFDNFKNLLLDTRAFTNNFGKNELIYYVNQILFETQMSATVAKKLLINSILNMLKENHFINISIALNLCPSNQHYKVLWDCLDFSLHATNEDEIQWQVWPLILVIGANTKFKIPSKIPINNIQELLNSNLYFKNLYWFKNLITPENFSTISLADWFNSKNNKILLEKIIHNIKIDDLVFNAGQNVMLFYALSYGNYATKTILSKPLKNLSLPLMQIWQQHFNQDGLTIFVNPLSAFTPVLAQSNGTYIKQQMQFDMFVSNAIKKIRIKNLQPNVIIATKEGGKIEILITPQTNQSNYQEYYSFIWNLNFIDNLNDILQNILNLLFECKINAIKLLKNPLSLTDNIQYFKKFDLNNSYIIYQN